MVTWPGVGVPTHPTPLMVRAAETFPVSGSLCLYSSSVIALCISLIFLYSKSTLPFYANYGFNLCMGIEPCWEVKVQAVEKFIEELKNIQREAKVALCKACDDMKHFAYWTCVHVPKYKPRNQVWLSTKNLNLNQPSQKLTERQISPYTITHIVSPNAVILKLPPSFKIDVLINVSQLCLYKLPTIPGQQIMLQPPVEIEGENEYVVRRFWIHVLGITSWSF